MATPERREAPRAKSELVLELYDSGGQLVAGVGRLLDLSTKGGRFESALRLKLGQPFRARLRFEDDRVLELDARVAWLRPKRQVVAYGMEFVGVAKRDLDHIHKWVRAHKAV
jgi:hypothetical protein